jgi:hypothetical protein
MDCYSQSTSSTRASKCLLLERQNAGASTDQVEGVENGKKCWIARFAVNCGPNEGQLRGKGEVETCAMKRYLESQRVNEYASVLGRIDIIDVDAGQHAGCRKGEASRDDAPLLRGIGCSTHTWDELYYLQILSKSKGGTESWSMHMAIWQVIVMSPTYHSFLFLG